VTGHQLKAGILVGGGRALAHHDGSTWMVKGALPGETVVASELQRRAGVVEAEVDQVVADPHPARIAEPCPHAPECGGCDWPHVEPVAGAALKAGVAAQAARPWPELAERLAAAPVASSPLAYRLRSRLHWDDETGQLGFYQARSWQVTPISECRIVSPQLRQALLPLAAGLACSCRARVDLEWLQDLDGTTAVIALRPARQGPPAIDPAWLPPPAALAGIVDGCHALSRSGKIQTGWGASEVGIDLPVPLQVPVGAFFQVNRYLVPWLFGRVSELAGRAPVPAWDLHAGVGFLAAAVSHAGARRLILVETFRPAARAAARNLPRARVAVGRSAESYLARQRQLPEAALVLTDPPRSGMTRALRKALAEWQPQRIITLACDPATWARDTDLLLASGYQLSHLELIDLFPSTHHVEVLALLEQE
jgi:23S rRNA (uracil1939-C5)-methyltransferase